jgi:dihydrofolate reductase
MIFLSVPVDPRVQTKPRPKEIVMGKIAVHEFITVDGVIDTPSWTFDYGFHPKMGEAIAGITGSSQAILLGRRTYEMFAPSWSTRTAEDDPGAPFFNDTPKYVVSSTLTSADWDNTTILGPYSAGSIRSLKDRIDGSIYVSGSGELVRAMLADGLVDDLHLFVYPLTLGEGVRLFPEGGPATKLSLAGSEAYDNGVVHLTYQPAS